MEFTEDELLIIEEALKMARDNTGDEEWADEIWSVLNKVRSKLSEGE